MNLRKGHNKVLRTQGDWYVVMDPKYSDDAMERLEAAVKQHRETPLVGSGGIILSWSRVCV